MTLAPSTYTVETDLGASAEDAWTAAVATYEELGIEVTYSRPGEEVGNRQFRVRRRLAGDRLSKYLRCGVDATGRPMADSYVVTLNVVSEVTGVTDLQSRMGTTVSATALKPGGTSTAPVVCASKGLLEERIAELVVGRVRQQGAGKLRPASASRSGLTEPARNARRAASPTRPATRGFERWIASGGRPGWIRLPS